MSKEINNLSFTVFLFDPEKVFIPVKVHRQHRLHEGSIVEIALEVLDHVGPTYIGPLLGTQQSGSLWRFLKHPKYPVPGILTRCRILISEFFPPADKVRAFRATLFLSLPLPP